MPSGTRPESSSRRTLSSYSIGGNLQGWYRQEDQLLEEITAMVAREKSNGDGGEASEREAKELIARTLGHFEEYYEHKSRAAHQNVFCLFSPTWCSSFECAFLWIAGFRPGVLLQLISDSIHDLSPNQTQALDRLKRETRVEEKLVADELARVQESAAAPSVMEAIREAAWLPEEQSFSMMSSEPIEGLRKALELVVATADSLRVTTAERAAEILTPAQCLKFLGAAIRLQQGMRSFGMQRDNLTERRGLR